MVERFEQQIAKAVPARISIGKEVAAEAVRKELLDQIPGVLLGTTRAAEVAIHGLPVAADEEVEDGAPLAAHARAQGKMLAPLSRRQRAATVGGRLRWIEHMPHRRDFLRLLDYQAAQCRHHGVAIETGAGLLVARPAADGRISVDMGEARLDWRVNRFDIESMLAWLRTLDGTVRDLGLGRVIMPPEGWERGIIGGPHHMGTTRMAQSARRGVVDEHCRVHSLDNLYVAGSSIFATGGYANPTFTLVALALRLADRLHERLT